MKRILIIFLSVHLLGATETKKDCPCTKILLPVCGSDGRTYSNACLAGCSGVAVQFTGSCPSVPIPESLPPKSDCPCTRELRLVCGADGRTYANPCLAKCNGVAVQFTGSCPSVPVPESLPPVSVPEILPPKRDCPCTRELRWVCGADGRTYANPCLAKCNQATIQFYGRCDLGPI